MKKTDMIVQELHNRREGIYDYLEIAKTESGKRYKIVLANDGSCSGGNYTSFMYWNSLSWESVYKISNGIYYLENNVPDCDSYTLRNKNKAELLRIFKPYIEHVRKIGIAIIE